MTARSANAFRTPYPTGLDEKPNAQKQALGQSTAQPLCQIGEPV